MNEQLSLTVEKRTAKGKNPNRRLRQEGMVLGVYYDAKGENINVQVASMPFSKLYAKARSNKVIELAIADGKDVVTKPAMIWKVVHHPVKSYVEHVDFYGIDLTKRLNVFIPVEIVGKAMGLVKGGVVNVYRDSLEVTCLPTAIPDKIVIDVTNLDLNQNIHIQDIAFPEGVKAIFEENFAVVGVHVFVEREEPKAEEAAAEGAEAAAAPAEAAEKE